jgi:hypothetical protein
MISGCTKADFCATAPLKTLSLEEPEFLISLVGPVRAAHFFLGLPTLMELYMKKVVAEVER